MLDVECEALLLLGDIDQRQGRAAEAHRRLAAAETLARAAGIPYLRIKVAFVLGASRATSTGGTTAQSRACERHRDPKEVDDDH